MVRAGAMAHVIGVKEREAAGQERGKPWFRSGLSRTDLPPSTHKLVRVRILVIEDERTLGGFVEQSLNADG